MIVNHDTVGEQTPLLHSSRLSQLQHEQDEEAQSIISSNLTKEEQHLAGSTVGERLPYNDYTTIDWLHDLVLESSDAEYSNQNQSHVCSNTQYRQKTLIVSAIFNPAEAFATNCSHFSMRVLAGLPLC